jgi:hypothetical protein
MDFGLSALRFIVAVSSFFGFNVRVLDSFMKAPSNSPSWKMRRNCMGVESKLYHMADEATDCCQIETRFLLSTRGRLDRRKRLVCPSPAILLARRLEPAGFALESTAAKAICVHGFHRFFFIRTRSNAIPIGKHEVLMKANFLDDVLGHFRASDSKLTVCYVSNVAALLTNVDQSARLRSGDNSH